MMTDRERLENCDELGRTIARMPPDMRERVARGMNPTPARSDHTTRLAADATEIEAMQRRIDTAYEQPRPNPEELDAARARVDTIAGMFGQQTSAPLFGESVTGYRQRLMLPFLKYSPRAKDVKLTEITDSALLDVIERTVREDAIVTATAMAEKAGAIVPIRERDSVGRMITRYVGDIGSWMSPYQLGGATCKVKE
jgi:hypothetical protein